MSHALHSSSSSSSTSASGSKHCGKRPRSKDDADDDDVDLSHPLDSRSMFRSLKRMSTRLDELGRETKSAEQAHAKALSDEKALKRKCEETSHKFSIFIQDASFIAARGDKYHRFPPSHRIFECLRRLDYLHKEMVILLDETDEYGVGEDVKDDKAGKKSHYKSDTSSNVDYCNYCGAYGRDRSASNQLGVLVTEIDWDWQFENNEPAFSCNTEWFAYNVDHAYTQDEQKRITMHSICQTCSTRWRKWYSFASKTIVLCDR